MRAAASRHRLLPVAATVLGIVVILLARKPHVLEFAHYYTGSKYFAEVGYDGLYDALAAALAEIYGREDLVSAVPEVRDLSDSGLLPVADVLKRFEEERGTWSRKRWAAFTADVRSLDAALDRHSDKEPLLHWNGILTDHGYNASPLYTAVTYPLVNTVALDGSGLWLLCGVDMVLLLAIFVLLAMAFGPYGASFAFLCFALSLDMLSYITWAFVRFDWLFAMAAGIFFLARRRWLLSGVFWGVAAFLRIFPGVIAAFFFLLWILGARGTGEGRGERTAFLAGVSGGAAMSAVLSSVVMAFAAGISPSLLWGGFFRRLAGHSAGEHLNGVGVGKIFEALSLPGAAVLEPAAALALAFLLGAAILRRKGPPAEKAALAVFSAPLFLYISHYYYLMLIFPAAVKDRTARGAVAAVCLVSLVVWGARLAGADYVRFLNAGSFISSLVLAAVPPVLFFVGSRGSSGPAKGEATPK